MEYVSLRAFRDQKISHDTGITDSLQTLKLFCLAQMMAQRYICNTLQVLTLESKQTPTSHFHLKRCCVCLREFELVEMPSCKHIFHLDCIQLWLYSHSTCPLCRSSISISSTKTSVEEDDDGHPDSPLTSPV